ncbi:MAG: Zn-dependent protease [Phycisphaerales bacterium]|nr:Zn-dependent protease [Phycisphaerales bacterium]
MQILSIVKRLLGSSCLIAALLLAAGPGCAASHNDSSVLSQSTQFHSSLTPAVMNSADLNNYLQSIGGRIVVAAKQADAQKIGPKSHFNGETQWMFQDIQFHLVSSPTLNAFTTGGHHVYIYNQLFQLCQNEDQLAAVMAHEYGHIYCRHVQKGMTNQMRLAAAAAVAGGAGYLAGGSEHGAEYAQMGTSASTSIGNFVNMGFTRDDEAQADEFGQTFYAMAGWDPAHFGAFFEVMKAKLGDVASAYMSDHPTLQSRIEAANKAAPNLEKYRPTPPPAPVADIGQFKQYQQTAVQVAARTPNDQQVMNTKQLLQALPRSCWVPDGYVPPDQVEAHKALMEKAKKIQDEQQKQQPAK